VLNVSVYMAEIQKKLSQTFEFFAFNLASERLLVALLEQLMQVSNSQLV